MDWQKRGICAAVAVLLAIFAVYLNRAEDEGIRLISSEIDWAILVISSALAGALILHNFVYPRRRGWFWPPVGGLLTAAAIMTLAVLPDGVAQIWGGASSVVGSLLTVLLGAIYAMVLAGPIFAVGATVLHAVLRRLEQR